MQVLRTQAVTPVASLVSRRAAGNSFVDTNWLRRWLAPTDDAETEDGGVADPAEKARAILAILLSSRFRKGSLESMASDEFVVAHLGLITDRVRRGEPVQLTLIGFPFKVPNSVKVGQRTLPDLAEVAALKALCTLQRAIQRVHPPGIEIVIIHDGTYIAEAFEVQLEEAQAYANYFGRLVRTTGTDRFIRCEHLAELMRAYRSKTGAPMTLTGDLAALEIEPVPDEYAATLRKTLGMLNVRFLPTSSLLTAGQAAVDCDPESLTGLAAILHKRARRAMRRYSVLNLLLHRFDPRPHAFPQAIHATSRVQSGRLALWLVNRGKSVLPWHGVGVLREGEQADVRYAIDIDDSDAYEPVFFQGESTPFLYAHVGGGQRNVER